MSREQQWDQNWGTNQLKSEQGMKQFFCLCKNVCDLKNGSCVCRLQNNINCREKEGKIYLPVWRAREKAGKIHLPVSLLARRVERYTLKNKFWYVHSFSCKVKSNRFSKEFTLTTLEWFRQILKKEQLELRFLLNPLVQTKNIEKRKKKLWCMLLLYSTWTTKVYLLVLGMQCPKSLLH